MSRWHLGRAGLFNFWYYDDLEIFEFADGKLLLRGGNGSGKSVTMQSLITVLLDGSTRANRLDPFGSQARRMEDYLLGEKDLVDREERTGYLFLEYQREDGEPAHLTTGIGLRATRSSPLQFWGFVIADGRRIGVDFELHREEYLEGKKRKVPLTKRELQGALGEGGILLETRGEYMAAVNRHVFGFAALDSYQDLIKLLIHLRSPKLSKDFKPSVIYEILNQSLSALTDEELKPLSDTVDNIDQTQQQCEQLEKERKSLLNLRLPYDRYNEFLLWYKADRLIRAEAALSTHLQEFWERSLTLEATREERETKSRRLQELEEEIRDLDAERISCENDDVYKAEKEKRELKGNLELKSSDLSSRRDRLEESETRLARLAEQRRVEEAKAEAHRGATLTHLQALTEPANLTAFAFHGLAEPHFRENHREPVYDFEGWRAETASHAERLREIMAMWDRERELRSRLEDALKETERARDILNSAREDAHRLGLAFGEAKDVLSRAIDSWLDAHLAWLPLEAGAIREIKLAAAELYEETQWTDVMAPVLAGHQARTAVLAERLASLAGEIERLADERRDLNETLNRWRETEDPEPPRHADTEEARRRLDFEKVPNLPLFRAVEFREEVGDAVRERIEAAIARMGLLDASIVPRNSAAAFDPLHDRILVPAADPPHDGATLRDLLLPAPPPGSGITDADILAVLASVSVATLETEAAPAVTALDGTGRYRIGPVKGHAPRETTAIYLGREARRRYRLSRITALEAELASLDERIAGLHEEESQTRERRSKLDAARDDFPVEKPVLRAFSALQKQGHEVQVRQEESERKSEAHRQALAVWEEFRESLEARLAGLPLEKKRESYARAANAMRSYREILNRLEMEHVRYGKAFELADSRAQAMEDARSERDRLASDIGQSQRELEALKRRLASIEERLRDMGADRFRQRLEGILGRIAALPGEIKSLTREVARLEERVDELDRKRRAMESERAFYEQLRRGWTRVFLDELGLRLVRKLNDPEVDDSLFNVLEPVSDPNKGTALMAANKVAALLQSAKPDTENAAQEHQRLHQNLVRAYERETANLAEYRPYLRSRDVPDLVKPDDLGKEALRLRAEALMASGGRELVTVDIGGGQLSPYALLARIERNLEEIRTALTEEDRTLYEEVITNNIGRIITERIRRTENWIKKMNRLMESRNISSGLVFSLEWKPKSADHEEELDTERLVDLLRSDPQLLTAEDQSRLTRHFRSRIGRAKTLAIEAGGSLTSHQAIRLMLDYREWFGFQLFLRRPEMARKKLSDRAFHKLSGGEKAMAMYIPLFSAAYSRYGDAAAHAPRVISLDEAFAGVDENNIRDMFDLMEQLELDYLINSQSLWGDYDTVPALSVCELVRPRDVAYVTVVRYRWNGVRMIPQYQSERQRQRVLLI